MDKSSPLPATLQHYNTDGLTFQSQAKEEKTFLLQQDKFRTHTSLKIFKNIRAAVKQWVTSSGEKAQLIAEAVLKAIGL